MNVSNISIVRDGYTIFPFLGTIWHNRLKHFVKGSRNRRGYLVFGFQTKIIYVHRFIYETYYNIRLTRNQLINHIDFNKQNNVISNLEVVTTQQNKQWVGRNRNNLCGVKGIHWYKRYKKWCAKIRLNNNLKHIGYFETKNEANDAYIEYVSNLNKLGHKFYLKDNINYQMNSRIEIAR